MEKLVRGAATSMVPSSPEMKLVAALADGFGNLKEVYQTKSKDGQIIDFDDIVGSFKPLMTAQDAKLAFELFNKYKSQLATRYKNKKDVPPMLQQEQDPTLVAARLLSAVANVYTSKKLPPVDALVKDLGIQGKVEEAFRKEYADTKDRLKGHEKFLSKNQYNLAFWKGVMYSLMGFGIGLVLLVILANILNFFYNLKQRFKRWRYTYWRKIREEASKKARWWKPRGGWRKYLFWPKFSDYEKMGELSPFRKSVRYRD